LATPASAQVIQQASVVHGGQTVALKYEPQVKVTLRQAGLGQRMSTTCRWKAHISVQRTAHGADGQPIAALSRTVGAEQTREGNEIGYCNKRLSRKLASSAGSEKALQAHVAKIAAQDAAGLRAELASLSALGAKEAYAR